MGSRFKVCIGFLILLIGQCWAAEKLWVGGKDPFWETPQNWSPADNPTNTDDIFIIGEGNQTVIKVETQAFFKTITMGPQSGEPTNATLLFYGGFDNEESNIFLYSGSMVALSSLGQTTPLGYTINRVYTSTPSILMISDAFVSGYLINNGTTLLDSSAYVTYVDNNGYIRCNPDTAFATRSLTNYDATLEILPGSAMALSGIVSTDYSTLEADSYLSAVDATIGVFHQSFLMAQSKADLQNSFLNLSNAYLLLGYQAKVKFVGDSEISDSIFWAENSNASIVNSTVDLVSTTFSLYNCNFNVFGTAKIELQNSYLLAYRGGGYLNMFGDAKLTAFSSNITIEKILFIDQSSQLQLFNSEIFILGEQNTEEVSFASMGNSSLNLSSQSSLIMNGLFYMLDISRTIVDNSTIYINGHMIMRENSNIKCSEGEFYITGQAQTWNDSKIMIDKSVFFVNGTLLSTDKSEIRVQNGWFFVPGNATLASFFYSNNSGIYVEDYFLNMGVFEDTDSIILVEGRFKSVGNTIMKNTKLTSNGTATFSNIFSGEDVSINVTRGDLIFTENSEFNCTNCEISVIEGQFVYQTGSKLSLLNTTLSNSGIVSSLGEVILFSGSSIQNGGQFTIESNIISLNENNSTDSIFRNTGSIQSNSPNGTIDVKISNVGIFSLSSHSNIYIKEFNQLAGGSLDIGGGRITSLQTINLQGGSLIGSGSINATNIDLDNSELGGKNQSDKLEIVGNLNQYQNSTTIIKIKDQDDYTNYNISNNVNINGTLIIYINKKMIEDSKNSVNVSILNYGTSNGDYNKIKILTYDPEDNDNEEEADCKSQTSKGQRSYSLLVQDCTFPSTSESNRTKVIAGAVVGSIVGAAVLVACYISYKKYLAKKLFKQKLGVVQQEMNKFS